MMAFRPTASPCQCHGITTFHMRTPYFRMPMPLPTSTRPRMRTSPRRDRNEADQRPPSTTRFPTHRPSPPIGSTGATLVIRKAFTPLKATLPSNANRPSMPTFYHLHTRQPFHRIFCLNDRFRNTPSPTLMSCINDWNCSGKAHTLLCISPRIGKS